MVLMRKQVCKAYMSAFHRYHCTGTFLDWERCSLDAGLSDLNQSTAAKIRTCSRLNDLHVLQYVKKS